MARQLSKVEGFKASKGWLDKFFIRFKINEQKEKKPNT